MNAKAIVLGGLPAAALVLACSSPPPPALEQARLRYAAAASSPTVQQNASVALYEAEQALDRAESAWRRDAEGAEIEHRARLAELRAETAEEIAERRALEQRAEALGDRRTAVRLSAREAEIASARTTAAQEALRADVAAQRAELATRRADAAEERIAGLEELATRRTERGIVVTLDDVLFAFDRADLQPGAQRSLDRVADYLAAHTDRSVSVEGHTDDVGSSEYNRTLSRHRADAVADYLRSRGIDGDRIQVVGYGESRPLVANESASARQQNRRVEVVIGETSS